MNNNPFGPFGRNNINANNRRHRNIFGSPAPPDPTQKFPPPPGYRPGRPAWFPAPQVNHVPSATGYAPNPFHVDAARRGPARPHAPVPPPHPLHPAGAPWRDAVPPAVPREPRRRPGPPAHGAPHVPGAALGRFGNAGTANTADAPLARTIALLFSFRPAAVVLAAAQLLGAAVVGAAFWFGRAAVAVYEFAAFSALPFTWYWLVQAAIWAAVLFAVYWVFCVAANMFFAFTIWERPSEFYVLREARTFLGNVTPLGGGVGGGRAAAVPRVDALTTESWAPVSSVVGCAETLASACNPAEATVGRLRPFYVSASKTPEATIGRIGTFSMTPQTSAAPGQGTCPLISVETGPNPQHNGQVVRTVREGCTTVIERLVTMMPGAWYMELHR